MFYIAESLLRTNLWWHRITVGDGDSSDALGTSPSQRYPNATFNYETPDDASHTAQTDSRKGAASFSRVLRERVGVQVNQP